MADFQRVELAPGYSIAPIINGCWQLAPDHGGGPASAEQSLRIFSELVDSGFTTFDCADIYEGTEELLGRFRASIADPDSIQVHTKYVPDRTTLGQLEAADIDAAIDRSLRRLGTDRLDLLQFHWWSYDVPGCELVTDRLMRAQQRGKVRLLGVTNFDTSHVRQFIDDGVPIVSLQAQYSLLDRRPEKHMVQFGATSGVQLLNYGALAGGLLSDRYLGAAPPTTMNRSVQKYRLILDEIGGWDQLQRLLGRLRVIADRHDTTVATVAGRWALDQAGVAAIILGTGDSSRVAEKRALGGLELDAGDLQTIAELLESQPMPGGDMYDLERDPQGAHAKIIKTDLHGTGTS